MLSVETHICPSSVFVVELSTSFLILSMETDCTFYMWKTDLDLHSLQMENLALDPLQIFWTLGSAPGYEGYIFAHF